MDPGGVDSVTVDEIVDQVLYEGDVVDTVRTHRRLTGQGRIRDVPGGGRWQGLGDDRCGRWEVRGDVKRDGTLRRDHDCLPRQHPRVGHLDIVFRRDGAAMQVNHHGE